MLYLYGNSGLQRVKIRDMFLDFGKAEARPTGHARNTSWIGAWLRSWISGDGAKEWAALLSDPLMATPRTRARRLKHISKAAAALERLLLLLLLLPVIVVVWWTQPFGNTTRHTTLSLTHRRLLEFKLIKISTPCKTGHGKYRPIFVSLLICQSWKLEMPSLEAIFFTTGLAG